jgi:hypothetical protein
MMLAGVPVPGQEDLELARLLRDSERLTAEKPGRSPTAYPSSRVLERHSRFEVPAPLF